MTTKYTTPSASAEVDRRCERYMAEHGCDYREAWHAVLASDKELAEAYAQPAQPATATKPAVLPAPAPVQGKSPGETVHLRVTALRESDASLTYQMAVNLVLAADPALRAAYARS